VKVDLNGLGLDESLNLSNCRGEELLLGGGVLERGVDLGNDGFCELGLLALLDGLLVADPGVKDRLDLGGDGDLLLLDEGLGLELGSLL